MDPAIASISMCSGVQRYRYRSLDALLPPLCSSSLTAIMTALHAITHTINDSLMTAILMVLVIDHRQG